MDIRCMISERLRLGAQTLDERFAWRLLQSAIREKARPKAASGYCKRTLGSGDTDERNRGLAQSQVYI